MKLLFEENRIAMLVHLATRVLIDFCCALFIDVIYDNWNTRLATKKYPHPHAHAHRAVVFRNYARTTITFTVICRLLLTHRSAIALNHHSEFVPLYHFSCIELENNKKISLTQSNERKNNSKGNGTIKHTSR